jgi:hypothetical protein
MEPYREHWGEVKPTEKLWRLMDLDLVENADRKMPDGKYKRVDFIQCTYNTCPQRYFNLFDYISYVYSAKYRATLDFLELVLFNRIVVTYDLVMDLYTRPRLDNVNPVAPFWQLFRTTGLEASLSPNFSMKLKIVP